MPRTKKATSKTTATVEPNPTSENMSETITTSDQVFEELPVIDSDADIVTTTEEINRPAKPELLIFAPDQVQVNSKNARSSYMTVASLIGQIVGAGKVNLPLLVFKDVHSNNEWTALDGNRRLIAGQVIEARKSMDADQLKQSIEQWEGEAEDSGQARYAGLRKAALEYNYTSVDTGLMAIAIPQDKMEDEGYHAQVMYLSGIAQERLKPSERVAPELALIKIHKTPAAAAKAVGGQRSHFSRVANVYVKKRFESLVRAIDDGWLTVEVAEMLTSAAQNKLKMDVEELLPKAISYALDNGARTISRALMSRLIVELEEELNPPNNNNEGGDDGENGDGDNSAEVPLNWSEIKIWMRDAAQMLQATIDQTDEPQGDRLEAYRKIAKSCDKLIGLKLKADKASNELIKPPAEEEVIPVDEVESDEIEEEAEAQTPDEIEAVTQSTIEDGEVEQSEPVPDTVTGQESSDETDDEALNF